MLKLQGIKKVYSVPSGDVHALKGIDLNFRKSEFVSILGPSGCGKTTTLNIIGGLDKYTEGDLIINGVSTKEFGDRDWDTYRNHSIGFVFQAYNLIPHQTILGNVELALTIAGVSKEERIKKAKDALDKVGLGGMYSKKPNQLSGGQCQRVAIARALVNDPDILLADEPTGALDSETSVQVMNLIKEIAKERLVIMVTHNPELAEEYSTRIVTFKDGLIIKDTNPYDGLEKKTKKEEVVVSKKDRPKMSFLTAFRLSLQNLLSKSKRTFMTAFAGAIGIIGISAVLSVSTGVNRFIDNMQEEMLASSPITISESAMDFAAMMRGMSTGERIAIAQEIGFVGIHSTIEQLVSQAEQVDGMFIQNDIDRYFVQFLREMPEEFGAVVDFQYGVNLSNNVFANFNSNGLERMMALSAIQDTYGRLLDIITEGTDVDSISGMLGMAPTAISQMSATEETLSERYELVDGTWPSSKNDLIIVLDEYGEVSDLTLAQLGILSQEEFINIVHAAMDDEENFDPEMLRSRISTEELLETSFMWFPNDVVFTQLGTQTSSNFTFNHIADGFDENDGVELNVVGIIQLKDGFSSGMLNTGFYHTAELTEYIISQNIESRIVEIANEARGNQIQSGVFEVGGTEMRLGIWYELEYRLNENQEYNTQWMPVGSSNPLASIIPGLADDSRTLSLRQLGGNDLPNDISIFSTTFESQDLVIAYLDLWNCSETDIELTFADGEVVVLTPEERTEITHQNMLALMMGLVSSFVDIITIALVAFTALSLIVSSVMIAIITYVSVVERIKEIGVIRSLGGRKKDVSRLFNAETFFIGTLSGVTGVSITFLLSALINVLVRGAIGMNIAVLTLNVALIMILVSIVLNMIAGFLPSRMAAKKDPVVALRSE